MLSKLNNLNPNLALLALSFLTICENEGLNVLVTCTYRSAFDQNKLYAQGRTMPGKIVTNAVGGQSEHNFTDADGKPSSKAFDIVPLRDKKAIWDEKSFEWQKIGKIWYDNFGEKGCQINCYYLDWYGRPNAPFHELSHFCLKPLK